MKHLDKFYNRKDVPWVNLIWNKYYASKDTPPHALRETGSFWWKDILRLNTIFRAISNITPNQGDSFLFWKDLWSNDILQESMTNLFSFASNEDISLKAFQNQELHQNFKLPLSGGAMQQLNNLLSRLDEVSMENEPDVWHYVWNSHYQSKKVYDLFFCHLQASPAITMIWKNKCTMKLKMFLWLLLMEKLNTREMLQRRQVNLQSGPNCVMCTRAIVEDSSHLFFTCPFAHQCWQFLGIDWNFNLEFMNMVSTARRDFGHSFFVEVIGIVSCNIWLRRNDLIFNNSPVSFRLWKDGFKGDFAPHVHRAGISERPLWQSWISSLH